MGCKGRSLPETPTETSHSVILFTIFVFGLFRNLQSRTDKNGDPGEVVVHFVGSERRSRFFLVDLSRTL